MASSNGIYLAVNKLYGTGSTTTANQVRAMYYHDSNSTTKQIRRAYSNNANNVATLVWDVWNAVLEASNFNIGSSGGTVADYANISSYGTDVANGTHILSHTVSPSTISPTVTDQSTTHNITVTQTATGRSVNIVGTQKGRVLVKTTYDTPSVKSTSINVIPAGGGTVNLIVSWEQTRLYTYDNNTTSKSTVTGTTTATVLAGSGSASISNGGVYKGSLGTTPTSQATVYTITSYKFSANGVSATKTGASISV